MQIIESIVSHGCFLRDCSVEHSLIGLRSRIESGVEVKVELFQVP
jgi:glucose-1-phosphate adenylyltransferase